MINLYSIPKLMALFSAIYSIALILLLSFADKELTILNAFKYISIFEIFIVFLFVFGWKYIWKYIPILNTWIFPDINGTWDVEIRWNWTQKDGMIKKGIKEGKIYIKQNFLTLSMELFTDESESETLVIQAKKNAESGRLVFYYIYRNTPKNNGDAKLQPHLGTAILKISPHTNTILQGNYFTDRNTQGVLKFIKEENT